jgi:predicted RNA-binding protein with EMAP domain
MSYLVPVSLGEIIDKITILEIKSEKIFNLESLKNIDEELASLKRVTIPPVDQKLIDQLKEVNLELWDVEDELRQRERQKDFSLSFVGMARSVYLLNDKRASLKKKINITYGSKLIEEKSYSVY